MMQIKFNPKVYIFSMMSLILPNVLSAYYFPENEDTEFGVSASRPDLRIDNDLYIPEPEKDGKIPTLNQTGFMTPDQNPFNTDFIEFAAQCQFPVLDIGAAYGLVSLPVLHRGAKVIANDIDVRHLLLLREQANIESRNRLFLNKKRFPNEMNFPDNSLGAILLCRVAHFLTGKEMEEAVTKMAKWLVPGGRVYVVTMSPYHHLLNGLLPIYLKGVKENSPWPGVITHMHEIAPHLKEKIPDFLHVMDSNSLGKGFKTQEFNVIKEDLFDYTRPEAKKSDNKGYYGVIAEKVKHQ